MLNTIIVALDSSNQSEQIIDALKNLAIAASTKIILSSVVSDPASSDNLAVDRPHQSPDAVYQALEQLSHRYQKAFAGTIEIEIVNGDPVEEIIRLAHIYNADLIVIGNRGLKGVKRVIESISSQVIADAPCSVFVVKLAV